MEEAYHLSDLLSRIHELNKVRSLNQVNIVWEDLTDQGFNIGLDQLLSRVSWGFTAFRNIQFEESSKEAIKKEMKLISRKFIFIVKAKDYHHVLHNCFKFALNRDKNDRK